MHRSSSGDSYSAPYVVDKRLAEIAKPFEELDKFLGYANLEKTIKMQTDVAIRKQRRHKRKLKSNSLVTVLYSK
jgi:hypothetical protein